MGKIEKIESPNFFAWKKTPPTDKRRDLSRVLVSGPQKTEKKINNQKKEVCVISPFLLASINYIIVRAHLHVYIVNLYILKSLVDPI